MSCTWINNEVNSVSSGINSAVSICKTTLYFQPLSPARVGDIDKFNGVSVVYPEAIPGCRKNHEHYPRTDHPKEMLNVSTPT